MILISAVTADWQKNMRKLARHMYDKVNYRHTGGVTPRHRSDNE